MSKHQSGTYNAHPMDAASDLSKVYKIVEIFHSVQGEGVHAGIPHVFMGWQPDLQSLLPKENYVGIDWGWWSQRYPDPQGTGHCDEHGHREVFKQIKSTVEVQCK